MAKKKTISDFDRAVELYHSQRFEDAAELFKKVLIEQPDNAEAHYNLACCYAVQAEVEDALAVLDRAIKLDVHCLDWARDDMEFSSLRNDKRFREVLQKNDPVNKPSLAADGQVIEDDKKPSKSIGAHKSKSGTCESTVCVLCGGKLKEGKVNLINPVVSLFVTLAGAIIALAMLTVPVGLLGGVALLFWGLYLSGRKLDTMVCQKCGAWGDAALIPPVSTLVPPTVAVPVEPETIPVPEYAESGTDPTGMEFDLAEVEHSIEHGAQPTEVVDVPSLLEESPAVKLKRALEEKV